MTLDALFDAYLPHAAAEITRKGMKGIDDLPEISRRGLGLATRAHTALAEGIRAYKESVYPHIKQRLESALAAEGLAPSAVHSAAEQVLQHNTEQLMSYVEKIQYVGLAKGVFEGKLDDPTATLRTLYDDVTQIENIVAEWQETIAKRSEELTAITGKEYGLAKTSRLFEAAAAIHLAGKVPDNAEKPLVMRAFSFNYLHDDAECGGFIEDATQQALHTEQSKTVYIPSDDELLENNKYVHIASVTLGESGRMDGKNVKDKRTESVREVLQDARKKYLAEQPKIPALTSWNNREYQFVEKIEAGYLLLDVMIDLTNKHPEYAKSVGHTAKGLSLVDEHYLRLREKQHEFEGKTFGDYVRDAALQHKGKAPDGLPISVRGFDL
ncbi:MAG: hypothetical protein OXR66_09160 [Candidatus Woesearchaeota archaeon]|nr:hypothetical protein [Candidatus Woesearchaeota archaeon]